MISARLLFKGAFSVYQLTLFALSHEGDNGSVAPCVTDLRSTRGDMLSEEWLQLLLGHFTSNPVREIFTFPPYFGFWTLPC